MTTQSALYFGTVLHKRVRPRSHRFRYRVFSLFVDLDELPSLSQSRRFFSYNRWNLISFYDRDHGCGDGALRAVVDAKLAAAGIADADGKVRLLCFPRVLGYVFNPLSIYFCHRIDGSLAALIYEVRNTFGGRHHYVIPVVASADDVVRQNCDKVFYVSPFLPMEARYSFRIARPGKSMAVAIDQTDSAGLILKASWSGRRVALTDAMLLRVFLWYPLMTLKIIAGIHWEALRLWLKKCPVYPHCGPQSRTSR